jgi:GntR family negative regulator for fad regulon and positive regulator of fabA
MHDWQPMPKPAEQAEERLLSAILDGSFPIGSSLPPERELCARLGVTRPTLREALQRLSRDGWIEIHHGRPTRVRDYWREGNLAILGAIAARPAKLPADFVGNLLQVRLLLAPAYTRQSVERARLAVQACLAPLLDLADTPEAYTAADWALHQELTVLSGNPVFTLIFNGFRDLYLTMGLRYFSIPQARAHSHAFYQALLNAAQSNDPAAAEALTQKVMAESMDFWDHVSK